ncbi:hypothetical protein LOAG_17884 [Loa loa]|uniref:Uncharacterized protein n=1 Tax=Loa loa TaxID=7209 RepID=A0A1S0UGZ7_LOALO|nr:hypothetical protein LOAG_17884 [Loa loa]EJD74865.1 hypothetical protein LOAG_17884 [Loa loa]
MKRGFRYLFNQEKSNNKDSSGNDDMEVEQKRGFFQKFFRPTSSLSGGEGTSTDPERRPLLHDDDGYAVIDRLQHEFVDKEKREMSAPVSPKSVTFEDELLFTTKPDRRGQSLAPPPTFLTDSTETITPTQQAFINFNYDVSQSSGVNSRHNSSIRSSRDASLALDEATHDLLRLSSQSPSIWYSSSSSRSVHAADRIPKSASTTSMNRVIKTKDGEMVKLLNTFPCDTNRLNDHVPSDKLTYVDDEGRQHQTVTVYTNQKRQGPPIVRTTVEGKLKMEKVVGADLISVEHCTCSAWTIRDIITHYKVKTTLGNRMLIMEESLEDENRLGDYKMSLYEDGQLKTRNVADFQIPSNMDKAKYLSLLSQRLLQDMETLNKHEERKTTTRVEVEVIENVTKILKTYIIGERNDLLQDLSVDQGAIDATDEFLHSNYQHKILASSNDHVDVLKNETDIKFLLEGHHYEDHFQIRPNQKAASEATTTSESNTERYVPLPCIYINVECTLKRMEDHSFNEVNVAVPSVFSVVLSLIRERIRSQLPNLISYGMEQHGKQYSGETTIRRLHHFESTDSTDELQTTIIHNQKEPSFLFEKPQIIEPVKIPVLNITELDLRRMADTSAILANFAIPRTVQNQLDIEHRYEFHEARGGNYGMQQKGQHFEGEMILKKKRRISLESESASEEEVNCGQTYLNLMKQEARGEFEVVIVISNDQRSSPKHFQETQPNEIVNLIAQISTDGKKEEVVVTLATKITDKEVYVAQEMSTVISNAMITMQKMVHLDDIFQQIVRNWNDKTVERTDAKFWTSIEEEVQVLLTFVSSIDACQEAYCIRAIPYMLHASFTGESFYAEDETVVIYMQNKLATEMMMSSDDVRQIPRFSGGHTLKTKATTEETSMIMLSIGYIGKYSNALMVEYIVQDVCKQKTQLYSRASRESEHVSNVSLNRGAKMLAASTRLSTCMKQKEQMTITEFGDEKENVAILLQRAGIMHGQVQNEWPEAVTGRLNTTITTTITITTTTITTTNTFNIFNTITDSFGAITNTDFFLSTDLTNTNTTTKHFHLFNFKTILPTHNMVQRIIPFIDTITVSIYLSIEKQQIPENSEIRIIPELCNIDEIKQQINEKEETTLQMLTKTTSIPVTKIEGVNDMPKMSPEDKLRIKQERMIPIKQIPGVDSSNINSWKEQFIDEQEERITKIDSDRTLIDYPFRNAEYVNDNRKMTEIFGESSSYLQNALHNVSQWVEQTSQFNEVREESATSWNAIDRSYKQQAEYQQKNKRMYLQESQYDEQPELHTFPRVKNSKRRCIKARFEENKFEKEALKGKLYNSKSETRVTMLNAGFDLDTTLLATPEMETQLTFAKDRDMMTTTTTSEYFSDERSWNATTEPYCKQRKTHAEYVSKSSSDLVETSLEENSETFDEISHISDIAHNRNIKHSEIVDFEKTSLQMTRSLINSLDASTLKEFLVTTEDEFSIVPETYNCDVMVGKSEQYEASSFAFSTGYHEQIQPKHAVEEEVESLVVKKKEEGDSKIDEAREKYRGLMSFREITVSHVQDQVPSLGIECQNEIFQQTTNSMTETMKTIKHKLPEPESKISNEYLSLSTGTAAEIYKEKVEDKISKVDYCQTTPQVVSFSPEVISKVSILEHEISQTDTFDKITRSNKQAWSEKAPISHDLQMSTKKRFEEINDQISYEERNTRYDAIVHFPPKPMKKSLLEEIVVTEKASLIKHDEMGAVTKIPETKILQQQVETVKEFEQVKQHILTEAESIERQMVTVGTYRETEFLEEMKQLKRETKGLTKIEQELKSCENEEVTKITEELTAQLIVMEPMKKPELFKQENMQETLSMSEANINRMEI